MTQKTSKPKRILFWILLLVCAGYGLEHIPGSYTIDDFQDEFDRTSYEGVALMALKDVSFDAELYFAEPARHRISRSAEILVPGGTTLKLSASMVPNIQGDEVVAGPQTLLLTSDQPLTFIYRSVTVAKSKTLKIDPDDPEGNVKVVGHYKILTALVTAYRYNRQKAIKREYKIPKRAKISLQANILPNHQIITQEGYSVFTGEDPGYLSIANAQWDTDQWTSGKISLSLTFSDLDPLIAQLIEAYLSESLKISSLFDLNLKRIYGLDFSENFLKLYVEGTIQYANSNRLANMFSPSFKSQLGIEFLFPRQSLVSESELGISLKNIYSLDFNRSNPLFDKSVRDMARGYRDKANRSWILGREFRMLNDLPGTFYIENMMLRGNDQGYPSLDLTIKVKPSQQL